MAAKLTMNEVRMSFDAAGAGSRGEAIARLTFVYLRDLVERELQHLDADAVVDRLHVPPLAVSFEDMDDDRIARAAAAGIHRALIAAL